jgi:hypothetical protein
LRWLVGCTRRGTRVFSPCSTATIKKLRRVSDGNINGGCPLREFFTQLDNVGVNDIVVHGGKLCMMTKSTN